MAEKIEFRKTVFYLETYRGAGFLAGRARFSIALAGLSSVAACRSAFPAEKSQRAFLAKHNEKLMGSKGHPRAA